MNADISLIAVLAAGLLAGCTSPRGLSLTRDYSAERGQVQKRLEEVFDAASRKDLPRLDSYHLYGPGFTKFGGGQPGRLDAAAARKGEHDGLTAVHSITMRAQDLKIDVFGDAAVATFLMNYTLMAKPDSVPVEGKERTTLILVNDAGSWKITHEHFSSFVSK